MREISRFKFQISSFNEEIPRISYEFVCKKTIIFIDRNPAISIFSIVFRTKNNRRILKHTSYPRQLDVVTAVSKISTK